MSQAPPELPDDARRQIDDRLDAIERVLLARNVSRLERRDIIDGVEAQIYDMLSARPETEPREAVAAMLAALDPPEAFATAGETGAAAPVQPSAAPDADWLGASVGFMGRLWQRWKRFWSPRPEVRRLSPPALLAAVWTALAAFIVVLTIAADRPTPLLIPFWATMVVPAPIAVTILGFMAVRRIRTSAGGEYGLPLAVIETFLFPVVLANLAVIALMTEREGLMLLAVLLVIVANIGLARYAWRRFGSRFLARIDSL